MKNISSKFLLLPVFLFVFTMFASTQTASAAEYPALCSVFTKTLLPGDSGEDVRQLQLVLSQEGIAYLGGTGFYGPVTERAVKTFQTRAGIYAVGKVGPQTFARMRALWCQGTSTTPGGTNPGNSNLDVTLTPTTTGGNNVSLSWASRGAVACRINNETVPLSGTKSYVVMSETSFVIICNDAQNRTVQKSISVRPTQTGGGSIPTINLYLNPTIPTINTYAYLYWTSSNANYCTLNGQNIQTSGSQQVYISGSATTFSITCYNSSGQSATQSISSLGNGTTNNGTLQLSITTNKSNYSIGESLVATVVVRNNSSYSVSYLEPICSLYGPFDLTVNGTDYYSFLETSQRAVCLAYGNSTITLAPNETKTYTYTALIGNKSFSTNSNNLQVKMSSVNSSIQQSANTYFTINGSGNNSNLPTSNISISPNYVTATAYGLAVNLTWSSVNANSCIVTGNGETYYGTSGNRTIYANTNYGTTNTYTINCTNSYGTSNNTASVVIGSSTGQAPTLVLTPTTINITSGQVASLSIYVTNVNYCSYTSSNGYGEGIPVVNNSHYTLNTGIYTSNGIITINCVGQNGQSISSQAIVNVGNTTATPTIIITPTTLNLASGQSANFTLNTTNISSCTYSVNNAGSNAISIGNSSSNSTTLNLGVLTSTSTILVNCMGTNSQTVLGTAVVNINSTASVTVTPSTVNVAANTYALFNVSSANVSACTVNGGYYSNLSIPTSGSINLLANTTTTYTFSCTPTAGGNAVTTTATINIP
jgi:hypothetical protein